MMVGIAPNFFLRFLNACPTPVLRAALGRRRLKFSREQLAFFLYALWLQGTQQRQFRLLYLELRPPGCYANFTQNLRTVARLMPLMFSLYNKFAGIRASTLLTIVDSSLLPSKQAKSIRRQAWDAGRVTLRPQVVLGKRVAVPVCGLKLMAFQDRRGRIFRAQIMPINTHDALVTKEPLFYNLKGVVLADRGFNSKAVRARSTGLYRLISPPHPKERHALSPQERRLYARRWGIEESFRTLKDPRGACRLSINDRYSKEIQASTIYSALLAHNLQAA